MSVMLYPCMLCVALLMCLFVLCVACALPPVLIQNDIRYQVHRSHREHALQ